MDQATAEVHIPVGNPQPVAIRGRLIRHLWDQYYRRVVNGGEGVAMPRSALSFITNALIALAAIKSLFQTHPLPITFSVISLLMYGLASAAELVISCAGLDPTSVYAVAAHLGKIVSLCILVISLASLFYM